MRYLFLVITLFFSTACQAQNKEIDCANAKSQAEMNQCVAKAFKKADQELNLVYKDVLSRLEPQSKTLLITAQKSWIQVRDSHCAIYAQLNEGGSMATLAIISCKTNLTENRIKELKTLLQTLQNR